ncbi:hypothetical protein V5799_004272 [Amblyomma americanum]|uniref:EGF-like domain-containing protein n=1 Tax=Amblyomma americanum TaxID=6943 RepID=A0AAQ4D6K7_AMBAM
MENSGDCCWRGQRKRLVDKLAEVWQVHLLILGALALPHRTDSNETTSKITAAPSKTLGIPVREGDIPLEAMRFVVPYMNTWATPADCCANGGTCIHGENGTVECLCTAAFSGPACLDDVNECLGRPCGRFSVCTNLYGSFRCDCMPGFQLQAHLCVREVSCEEGPCLNGGTCVTREDLTDVCYCKIGFRGRLCEIAVPECSLGTCPRGTFCVSTRRGFRCLRSLRDLQPGYRVPALLGANSPRPPWK